MSNLKFSLCILEDHTSLGHTTGARVFDLKSLLSVHRAIQVGVFGHYSKKRYFLATSEEVARASEWLEYSSERPYCKMERKFLLYPNGGRVLNADIFALFKHEALTF